MVLYTIINEYDVLQAQNEISAPSYRKIDGGYVEYRKGNDGKVISRLLTTDLSKYLLSEYQPFTKL